MASPSAARWSAGGIGAFVTLGNGLIQDRMEGIVGAGNLLACLVEWGGSNVGPGRLVRDSSAAMWSASSTARVRERTRALARRWPAGARPGHENVRGMISSSC